MIPFMWCGKRAALAAVLGLAGACVSGCKDGCDPESVHRATEFVDAHQSCETDDDCVIVDDHCGQLSGGFCGQLRMNRAGAVSSEWRALDAEIGDCAPDSCSVCGAAAVPTCTAGSCRPPQ
jgi:hypothetical protein